MTYRDEIPGIEAIVRADVTPEDRAGLQDMDKHFLSKNPRTEGYRRDMQEIKAGKRFAADLFFFQNGRYHGESMYIRNGASRHGDIVEFFTHLKQGWYARRYRIDANARLLVYEGLFRD